MKRFSITITCVLTIMLALQANLAHASVEDELTNICTIIKNNDKNQLRLKLKRIQKTYRVKLNDLYTGVVCNSHTMVRFAVISGADDAGIFLTRKLSKKLLRAAEQDGSTILQWAEANGHAASAVMSAVQDRIQ